MENKGLCSTCIQVKSCIFTKNPPVWDCEEFYHGNSVPKIFNQTRTSRVFSREVATESE